MKSGVTSSNAQDEVARLPLALGGPFALKGALTLLLFRRGTRDTAAVTSRRVFP